MCDNFEIVFHGKLCAVCNYISEFLNNNLEYYWRKRNVPSTKRIQRLLYLCYIAHLNYFNGERELLTFLDLFYAWPTGPVIPAVYRYYIQHLSGRFFPKNIVTKLTEEEENIILSVLTATKDLTERELEDIVKVDNGPWREVYNEDDIGNPQIISRESIYNFYKGKTIEEIIEGYKKTPGMMILKRIKDEKC